MMLQLFLLKEIITELIFGKDEATNLLQKNVDLTGRSSILLNIIFLYCV